ncbi:MAG TPA: MFS transporter, partial [Thermodesulfobacteriota bacterium]|nr:MFS transporter [Thermodesulfobacteriota bacterium]
MILDKRLKVLALASGVLFIDMIGYGVVVPILPLYASRLGATATEIGFLFASYSFVFLFALLPLCHVVDSYGKKKPVVLGMFFLGISSLFYASSTSLFLLTISRMLQGFSASLTWAAALPLASQVTTENRRGLEMSIISIAIGLGSILGPVIGGLGNFHTPFYFLVLVTFCLGLLCLFSLEEPEEVKKHKEYVKLKEKIVKLWQVKEVQCSCLAVVFCWFFWGMLEVLFPLYLQAGNYPRFVIGILFGVSGVAFVLFQPIAGIFSDRVGRMLPILLGLLFLALIAPIPFHLITLSYLLASMVFLGLVSAFIYAPTLSLIGDAVPEEDQGIAYGLNTWMFSVSYIVGPWFAGVLADIFNLQLPFYVCSVVMIIGSI